MATNLSILIRNRNAFLTLIVVIAALKLLLSAIAPASFELRDTITLVSSGRAPIGPWLALYPPLYNQTASNFSQLGVWWLAPPPSMDFNSRTISILFRLPVFAFDLATAVVLYYVGKRMASANEGRLASLIWFVNPFTLFSIELLGVPDIVATFLVLVAFSLFISRRFALGGVVLALGTWMKFFPVLLLPPLLLYAHAHGVSWKHKAALLGLGLIGLAGYLSWILPVSSATYLTTYSPVTQPFPFVAGQSAVNGSAYFLVLFYCLLLLFATRTKNLIALLLPTLLAYYAISNPSFQYLIWAMPLMALDVALVNRSRALLYAILSALAFTAWFFVSPAFLTPSGYSLLMIPLGGGNLPWYSRAVTTFLDNRSVYLLLVPLISSSLYASILAYGVDVARSWFTGASAESQQQ